MKKIVSLTAAMCVICGVSHAAPSHIAKNKNGGYTVQYDYNDRAKKGWYLAGRAGLSLLNLEIKEKVSDGASDSDKVSFKPVFAGSAAVGRHINYFWRAELEAGYIGPLENAHSGLDFDMSTPYIIANGYRDFTNGLYLGLGAGIAMPITDIKAGFVLSDGEKTSFSPMGAVMFGWAKKLDYNFTLDLRYRLAGFGGIDHKVTTGGNGLQDKLTTKINFVLDNSITVGLRYEF